MTDRPHALELVDGRHDVEQRRPYHLLGMVKRQPVGDSGATVMADDHEALVAQIGHERDQVRRHLPFGVPLAERPARWRLRSPVAAQVRGDDAMGLRQLRRDPVPAGVGLREAVQQEQRSSATALADEVARLPDAMRTLHEAGQRHAPPFE